MELTELKSAKFSVDAENRSSEKRWLGFFQAFTNHTSSFSGSFFLDTQQTFL